MAKKKTEAMRKLFLDLEGQLKVMTQEENTIIYPEEERAMKKQEERARIKQKSREKIWET